MLEQLKQEVYEANLALVKYNLAILTWGNVSAREGNNIIIKPSGVDYATMNAEDMVVVDVNGNIIEGKYKPSSDTPTHIELYKAFKEVKGICHTHSTYATSFAQAGKEIECMGTTHADYFLDSIPCTRDLTKEEIEKDYEKNTGKAITDTFKNIDYKTTPSVLVKSHGIFSWGNSAKKAVEMAIIIEELAKINFLTLSIAKENIRLNECLTKKHFYRKHGENKYYGQ